MTTLPHADAPDRAFAHHQHRELLSGIDRIDRAADSVGRLPARDLCDVLLGVIDWSEHVLAPHAAWEDRWLYPEIDRRAGTPWATKLMRAEHAQILAIAAKLDPDRDRLRRRPTERLLAECRARLIGLEALLRAHIEREERYLMPLLDDETLRAQERRPD